MFLILTAIDTNQQTRHFTWRFTDLDICFDVLSQLRANGNQLLRIELVDHGKHTLLPVEAFDGTPFSTSTRALKLEWQQLLNYPAS